MPEAIEISIDKRKINIPSAPSYENICRYALIILCALIAVSAPLYWILANPPEFISLEKRYRAQWPAVTGDTFLSGRWGERVETWMADHMPAREFYVGIDSYIWYASGRQAARDVIVDGDGNLLEEPPAYSPEELRKRLDKIGGFVKSIAVPTVILTPLNAGYVAQLPPRLARSYEDGEIAGAINAYVDGLKTEGTDIAYTDLGSVFTGSDEQLYYRTDHHWNGEGAYTAYAALGDALGYTPFPREYFTIEEHEGFYGSTYAKSGLWLTRPDTISFWAPPDPVRVTVMDAGKEPDIRDSFFFNEYLSDWDMYSAFLGGIHGLTLIENMAAGAAAGPTLYVIKDSYANSLIPLLSAHYNRIVAVDLRYYRGAISELYNEYNPAGADSAAGDNATDTVTTADAAILFVYSMNHIVNDPDIMWLR